MGEMTVLQISKKAEINRITTYKILRELSEKGLVKYNPNIKPLKFSPPSQNIFEEKVEQKRLSIQDLAKSYLDAFPDLEKLYREHTNEIKVKTYFGREQARELCWNALKANGSIKSFGYRSMRESIGYDFLVKWWNEQITRGIVNYMIANPETYKLKTCPGPVEKEGFLPDNGIFIRKTFEVSEMLIINETFIYNDVFAVLFWNNTSIFGVEIYHPEIARQQEIIFDDLWNRAKEYTD
jgi:sugar-specific transcriptional regulator TrmB